MLLLDQLDAPALGPSFLAVVGGYELIEERGRLYGSDDPKCGFTDHCDKWINGNMVTTLWRPAGCTDHREEPELVCPADATRAAPNAPKQRKSTPEK